jgi:secondary thiamine-phosphate synthase enzyme
MLAAWNKLLGRESAQIGGNREAPDKGASVVVTKRIRLHTKGSCDIVDITRQVAESLSVSGLKAGTATVFIAHSTAGITITEYEPGLVKDLKALFERLAPRGGVYEHDSGAREGNGHAHVLASLVGPTLSVPFDEGRLLLGTWQQIVLVDFDNRPRTRQVVLQFAGE